MSYKATGARNRPERMKPVFSGPGPSGNANPASGRRDSNSSTASSSSIASFHSTHSRQELSSSHAASASTATASTPVKPVRFSPSQEQLHVTASNDLKSEANTQFSRGDFSSALQTYDRAIAELPVYLDYELAVLQSNIAACHIRLEEWRDAIKAAQQGWDCLEAIDPTPSTTDTTESKQKKKNATSASASDGDALVELPDSNTEADDAALLNQLALSDQRRQDVRRIRTKILLRRARAQYVLGTLPPATATGSKKDSAKDRNPFAQAAALTSSDNDDSSKSNTSPSSAWSHLSAAQADYQLLAAPEVFSSLPAADQRTVRSALVALPQLVERAKEREVAEMMGKLKELGNGILRPFGLSTDMFQMEKDPVSGGMSLKFDGGGGSKK